jgi:hypothetical protein
LPDGELVGLPPARSSFTPACGMPPLALAEQAAEKEDRMYVTVRRYENVTDPKEAGRQVEEVYLRIVSDIPGFIAYYWVDAGSKVLLSVSVFQNKAGAEESNRRAAAVVKDKMASVLPTPPQITAGDVVLHEEA